MDNLANLLVVLLFLTALYTALGILSALFERLIHLAMARGKRPWRIHRARHRAPRRHTTGAARRSRVPIPERTAV
jgi:hypothetical protein